MLLKKKQMSKFITENIEVSDDFDKEYSDYSDKKILMNKYKKLLLVEIRVNLFILHLFKKFAMYT